MACGKHITINTPQLLRRVSCKKSELSARASDNDDLLMTLISVCVCVWSNVTPATQTCERGKVHFHISPHRIHWRVRRGAFENESHHSQAMRGISVSVMLPSSQCQQELRHSSTGIECNAFLRSAQDTLKRNSMEFNEKQ
jgi:hypothetical protein